MLPGKWKDWEITDEIGRGSYGAVYQIEYGDQIMAVKIIEIPQKEEVGLIMKEHGEDAEAYCRSIAQDFETEINTLKLLADCDHLIKIRDHIVKKKEDQIGWTIYIFMDCLESFTEYVAGRELSEEDVIRFTMEITDALKACQDHSIIHRDIKPENILVTEDRHFLLCDFGLARQLNYKQKINSVKGTYKYMAPEVYHGDSYTASIDIYSLGLIVYQYMNRRRGVFIPTDKKTIYFKDEEAALARRMSNEPIDPPAEASEEFADIILRMIAYDPKDRYQSCDRLQKDLIRLQKGSYRKRRTFALRHYRRQIAAALLVILIGAGLMIHRQMYIFHEEPCGESASCSMTNGGVLTIRGRGNVNDNAPWYDRKEKIKKLVVEEGISSITAGNDGLFSECGQLREVRLPQGLTEIGENTFEGCRKLTRVSIPDSLEACREDAFFDTPWLADQADENGFTVVNNLLVGYSGTGTSISIPEGVEGIETYFFAGHEEIQEVTLPESLIWIAEYAFDGCTGLKEVTFKGKVKEFGVHAFRGTPWQEDQEWAAAGGILLDYNGTESRITQKQFPQNIKEIGPGAFSRNLNITTVTIPKHIDKIGYEAFSECPSLISVIILGPVTDIEYYTFGNCTALQKVELPDTIQALHPLCLYNCIHLKDINIPEDAILMDSEDGEEIGDPWGEPAGPPVRSNEAIRE